MAYNPSEKVRAAAALGKQFGADQVIVLLLNQRRGTMEYVSWGYCRKMCDQAKQLAEAAYPATWDKLDEEI